jgi:hypothetical protein
LGERAHGGQRRRRFEISKSGNLSSRTRTKRRESGGFPGRGDQGEGADNAGELGLGQGASDGT